MTEHDISDELWREYDLPSRPTAYRIDEPQKLFLREGGITHRVVDKLGVVHCVPAPGEKGCVLRWQPRDPQKPVQF